MRMNWLCDNVIGRIPPVEELLPMSRETTKLLALPQDTLPRSAVEPIREKTAPEKA